jgi:hypothetical protein
MSPFMTGAQYLSGWYQLNPNKGETKAASTSLGTDFKNLMESEQASQRYGSAG